MEIRRKHMTRRVLRFNITQVIRNDTDRSATYDFLLVIHSNYGLSLSYHFQDKRRFYQNAHIFTSRVYPAPSDVVCLGILYRQWYSKARRMPLADGRKSLTCSFVYTRYRRSADRLTARQN